jgi:hypothetical protein
MATKEECQRHAAELVRIAQRTDAPNAKAILLDMANAWRKLAERADDAAGGRDGLTS